MNSHANANVDRVRAAARDGESPCALCGWRWLVAWAAATGVGVFIAQEFLDVRVAAMAHWRGLDPVRGGFDAIAQVGSSMWYIVALGVVTPVMVLVRRTRLARQLMFVLTAVLVTGLLVQVLKIVAGRHRPKALVDDGLYGFTWFDFGYETASFPSGHTATITAVAAAMWIIIPKWRDMWLIPVGAVAVSRMLSGSHYLSDVIAGAFVGAATTFLVYRLSGLRGAFSLTGSRSRPITATQSQSPVE